MVESRRYSNSCFEARQYDVMLMLSTMMIPVKNLKMVYRQPDLLCLDQDAVKSNINITIKLTFAGIIMFLARLRII